MFYCAVGRIDQTYLWFFSFDDCMLQHMLVADWQAANAVIEFAIVKIEDVEAQRAYFMARRLALLNT